MDAFRSGELVTVGDLDGIVFDTPSPAKVVVAVADPGRGAVLRTVPSDTVTGRASEGPHDQVLRALLRRTPPPSRGGGGFGGSGGHGRAGHTRGAAHRPTGR